MDASKNQDQQPADTRARADTQADVDTDAIAGQQAHWATTFETNPDMYGTDPSASGLAAAETFAAESVGSVLELGAGQGRDTLYLARQGLQVTALDYAHGTVESLAAASRAAGLADLVSVARHDLRDPLPLRDAASMRPTPTCCSPWR